MDLARTLLLAAGMTIAWPGVSRAQGGMTLTTLASFNGTDGAEPHAKLVWGADGSLYGTTLKGGQFNLGTVFRMTSGGNLVTLASFDGTNGAYPWGGLVQDTNGDFSFYGTASSGGTSNLGTVFRVTTNGSLSALVSFTGTNGATPHSELLLRSDGAFYGTTYYGGTNSWPNGYGTVFRVTTSGTLTTLVSFDSTDGAGPFAGLAEGGDGSLYGTTLLGGVSGFGNVFKVAAGGALIPVATFDNANGALPYAGLTQQDDGNFYGTTYSGGASNLGTVFQVKPGGALTSLVSFRGTNGVGPLAGLTRGSDGNLYGTTAHGTGPGGAGDRGTVFQLAADGSLTTLVSFAGANGAYPYATLVLGADGNLYGTTGGGGASGNGTVFRLSAESAPAPVFQNASRSGASLLLTWTTVSGRMYQMRYRTNLNQAAWTDVGSSVTATGSTATASYPIGPEPQKFYRVVLLP